MSGNCELLVDTVGGWILDGEQRKVNALPVHESLNRRGCNIVTVRSGVVGNREEIGRKWKLTIWG